MATNTSERASFLCDYTGKSITVYVRGEIDHHTAVIIRNGIDAVLFEKRPTTLRLDLSAVSFMDSSGLGLIMGRLSVMKELGGSLMVINPSRETKSIMTLAGMERIVPIAYTREDEQTDLPSALPSRGKKRTGSLRDGSEERPKNRTPARRKQPKINPPA